MSVELVTKSFMMCGWVSCYIKITKLVIFQNYINALNNLIVT